ncbi:LuxR C-terminal-related transcriptional regulator [Streptomyces sp. NPDC004539]|uniref:ATP-binding protein n=1 Tax=Streptomyces sp. NPDC004539 TaxID=3154280 RepID=UPI0033B9119A
MGRRQEAAELRCLLGEARLVTLTGTGGVGKTRLALEVAAGAVKAFPDGAWLVDLAPVCDPVALPDAVATAMGLLDQGMRAMPEQLTTQVSERRSLLVLDNCEHLLDACAELAQRLLSAAPELRVLATSREPLRVTGEHVFPVPPLSGAEATELLRSRTTAARPGFAVTDENRAAVTRLCADLDGLPLAIELAATRLRTLSVEQVVERLENRFALLTAGSRTARPHQRTLRAAIDWSWELCTLPERLLWSRLTVFAGSFTLEAAENVCAGEDIEAGDVMDLLDRLVAQSLVEHFGSSADPPRYRLLESIRQYGREHLVSSGEDELLRRRHRDFFHSLAERSAEEWFGPRQVEILDRLRAEHGNLLAALEYRGWTGTPAAPPGPTPEEVRTALSMATALGFYWVAGGFLGEGRRQLERALAAAPEPTGVRARALVPAVYVAQMQGDLEAGDRWLAEAEELAERVGEPAVRASAQGYRGIAHLHRGRVEEAVPLVERALAVHATLGDRHITLIWQCTLAIVLTHGRDPRAPDTARHALAATQAYGERWLRAHLLMALGHRAWELGRQAEAKHLTFCALDMLRGFAQSTGVARMIEQLAWIAASDGDHPQAGRLLGVARSLWRETGSANAIGGPQDAGSHLRCEAEVRQALGPAGYEQALADGSAVHGLGQAIAYALGARTDAEVAAPPEDAGPLTHRERQVAALVARGMTNRRIAAELVLSPRTVDGHVDRILTKLGFSSRAQIAAWWAGHQVHTP